MVFHIVFKDIDLGLTRTDYIEDNFSCVPLFSTVVVPVDTVGSIGGD